MIKDRYFTTVEAGKLLGFTPDHVRHLIVTGFIKAEKIGKSWLIELRAMKGITRKRSIKKRILTDE